MTFAVNRNLSNCEIARKKKGFRGFNGSGTRGLYGRTRGLLEHCSANTEAMGSNSIEAPQNLFSGLFRNCLNCNSLRWSHIHFSCLFYCSLAGYYANDSKPYKSRDIAICTSPPTGITIIIFKKGH